MVEVKVKDKIDRLSSAIRKARLVLRRYRDERTAIVKEYVGAHYSEEGARQAVPLNLIALYCSIVSRNLIAKNPRVLLSTFDRASRATVAAEQEWVNREVERMNLASTLGRAVLDGLIGGPGIVKVALATPSDSAVAAWNLRAGHPFAERVDLDDFVFDVHARDFGEVGFIGHRYRVPLDTVRDSKLYGRARKDLSPAPDDFFNAEGDERISTIGREFYSNEEEFEEMVDLWEVYLPRHRVVLTLADERQAGPGQKLLREQKWLGPDCGPYHLLKYLDVPGNPMPKSPCQDLIDLHLSVNNMLRKVIRQAARLKQNTFVQGGADEDGNRVMRANDGDIVKVDNPQNVTQYVSDGPNQVLFGVMNALKETFSWAAGNLDMLGGLSPQSHTATQDELLAKSAGGQVQDMQETTVTFTSRVVKALLWYWHKHPSLHMKTASAMPGVPGVTVPRSASPEDRSLLDLADLDVRVDPYSLRHQTPETRLQGMQQVVQTVVLPMMQLLVQQGISFDLNKYLQKVGQYMDDPDLAEILTIVEPPPAGRPPGAGGAGPKPAQTKRTYERVSRPGRTNRGDAMAMINGLMGTPAGGDRRADGQPRQVG